MSMRLDDAATQYATAIAPVTAMPLTIACRFNTDDASNVGTLMALDDDGAAIHFFRMVTVGVADPKLILANMSWGGFPNEASAVASVYAANVWNSVSARFTSTSERSICLNGTITTNTDAATGPSGITKLRIGAYRHPSLGYYQLYSGLIADVAVWSVALSDGELRRFCNGENPSNIRPGALRYFNPCRNGKITEDLVRGIPLTLTNGITASFNAPYGTASIPPLVRRQWLHSQVADTLQIRRRVPRVQVPPRARVLTHSTPDRLVYTMPEAVRRCMSQSFTVSLWAKPASGVDYDQQLFYIHNATAGTYWLSLAYTTYPGNQQFRSAMYDGSNNPYVFSANPFGSLDTWYHVAFVRDTVADKIRFYIDGTLIGDATDSTTSTPTIGNIFLGEHGGNLAEPFGGNLADVVLWQGALTAGEVAALARRTDPRRIRDNAIRFHVDWRINDRDRISGVFPAVTGSPKWDTSPLFNLPEELDARELGGIWELVTASSAFPYYLHTNNTFGAFGLGHTTGLIAS